ncbi:MAG: four helix bundle protein [Tepidisphaeraceae bacterium]|jgi:four helix bundle protein
MGESAKTFEELAVFVRSRTLVNEVYRLTRHPEFRRDRGLVDQIRRAAVSILSNIAEGFERGGNVELIQFLYIAKGSCGEVRAQLMIAADQKYIDPQAAARLHGDCRRIIAMLSNLIAYLRRSPLRGPKYAPPGVSKEFQAMLNKYLPKSPTGPEPSNP